jgi:hypothetical protein
VVAVVAAHKPCGGSRPLRLARQRALAKRCLAPLAAVWEQERTLKTDDVAATGASSRKVDP